MLRIVVLSILFCFVTFNIGFTASTDNKVADGSPDLPVTDPDSFKPEPTQHPLSTTEAPKTTTKPTPIPTTVPTPPPPTNATTTPPPVTNATTTISPPITNATTSTPKPGPTPTPTPTPPVTNATTTLPTPTTAAPHPAPSDRKFDAFSFLGGFALGLGLVAIGFLSWKFYLSRQENYYHTL